MSTRERGDTLGFLLADVARLMRRAFRDQLDGSSLTFAQARALVYVARHEGIRQVDLADVLEIQPMTVARLIDQLAADGIVERRADADDRRAYRIHLTKAAGPHLAAIDQVVAAIRKDAVHKLDREHVAVTLATLMAMRDNLARNR